MLLVEDDLALGPMVGHALMTLGHRFVLAESVPAAYGHLTQPHEFELILLDLELGNDRSEHLIERLRCEEVVVPTIIIFSALPVIELQRAAQTVGTKHILQKSASVSHLKRAIEAAIA
jgi:DNA-binding response OmpR family regulator